MTILFPFAIFPPSSGLSSSPSHLHHRRTPREHWPLREEYEGIRAIGQEDFIVKVILSAQSTKNNLRNENETVKHKDDPSNL